MSIKIKDPSTLVAAALALDTYLSEIVRLGAKIETLDFTSEFEYQQAQRLMNRFTECGQGVSDHIVRLSSSLNEVRAQAEAAAQVVSARAEEMQARQNQHLEKMNIFRALGEKVRALTLSLNDLKNPKPDATREENRAQIAHRLVNFEAELRPLIEEARTLKREAQSSKLREVERGADSLAQSLLAVSRSLENFKNPDGELH